MDDADRAQSLSECWLADRLCALRSAGGKQGRPGLPPEDRPCARCGEPIGTARLAAIREARHCLDCQEEIEAMLRHTP